MKKITTAGLESKRKRVVGSWQLAAVREETCDKNTRLGGKLKAIYRRKMKVNEN